MKRGSLLVLTSVLGVVAGVLGMEILLKREIEFKDNRICRLKSYYSILNQWLMIKNEGKQVSTFFIDRGYYNIAIYGVGELGNRLIEELKTSDIKIKYGIDKNASSVYSEIEVVDLEEDLPKVDAIVVTAAFAFDEVEKNLSLKTNAPIISIEDVVFEV